MARSGRPAGRPRRGGFTLIEVMVATAMLSVAALVAFPTILSFIQLSDAARQEDLATQDLMAAVEDVVATPFSRLTTTYADGQEIPKYALLHLPQERIVVDYVDPNADPLHIAIVATWADAKGHPRQETFRCVRTR